MDWLAFWSEIIKALSWPVAVVVLAAIFKKELPAILRNIKRIKAGGVEIERLEKVAEAVESKLDESDDNEEDDQTNDAVQINQAEQNVLSAIINSRFAMRSITGVSKETGLNKATVNRTYSDLIAKGLLEQTRNSEGRLRWYPTNLGRKSLARTS
ncbi:MarR family transcriptional regulator [Halomonas sp. KHS3]|uniref:MarR family transcriptional regulator n=1 Tax=Halomonas sp. KHS3 TaxID=866350 RepID=UPI00059ADE83|nr:helix-turn-helix domain-containing protein [Halomonas sp. KHS3]KIN14788.1 hypothetical protein RO22_11250 [Halomonas sp. KHS3]